MVKFSVDRRHCLLMKYIRVLWDYFVSCQSPLWYLADTSKAFLHNCSKYQWGSIEKGRKTMLDMCPGVSTSSIFSSLATRQMAVVRYLIKKNRDIQCIKQYLNPIWMHLKMNKNKLIITKHLITKSAKSHRCFHIFFESHEIPQSTSIRRPLGNI